MNPSYQSKFLDDPGFQSVLVECLQKLERGETLDREDLLQRHSDYAEPLAEFLDDQMMLKQIASDIRSNSALSPTPQLAETILSSPMPTEIVTGDRIRYIGEYEILAEIARGGMGVVFKARQERLKRVVALKMILSGRLADASDIERFQREAQAAAKLQHPNIVAVHEIGEHDGHHYFTMDFIDGQSLNERLREEALPPRRAAEIVQAVSKAIHIAHEQGMLHRDLKPGNILLDGEGVPKVTDFGLAKMLNGIDEVSRAELTASGQILGTPSYMSPEQAAGKNSHVGPGSDIYSLGAILYACLTGRPPFVADTPVDTLFQVIRNEPASPQLLNPKVPKDLETICLKCLEKEPHKRYGSAELLADDLERFLEGRTVLARPVGPAARFTRWCRRNPIVSTLATTALLLLVVGTVVSSWFAIAASNNAKIANDQKEIAQKEKDEANRQESAALFARLKAEALAGKLATSVEQKESALQLAQQHEREALWNLYVARLFPMKSAWQRQDYGELDQLLEDARPKPGEPDYRGWEWYYFQDQCRQASQILDGENEILNGDWCWKTDRMALATSAGTVEIREGSTRRIQRTLPEHQKPIRDLEWSPDGRFLACSHSRFISLWNAEAGELVHRWDPGHKYAGKLAWSPDSSKLSTAGWETKGDKAGEIKTWNPQNGSLLDTFDLSERNYVLWVRDLEWHPDGNRLVIATRNGRFVVWDTQMREKLITKVVGDGTPLDSVAWSTDGKLLATGHVKGMTILDDQWEVVATVSGNLERGQVRWNPEGTTVAGGGDGQSLIFWNRNTQSFRRLSVHGRPIQEVSWSPDGSQVLILGKGIARRVPIAERDIHARIHRIGETLIDRNDVHWSPDGTMLLATHYRGTVFCDPNTGEVRQSFNGNATWSSAWSPDSKRACTLTYRGSLQIWDTSNPREIRLSRTLNLQHKGTTFVDWSPNGKWLAIGAHNEKSTVLYNTETWEHQELGGGDVWCLRWSPDGDYLATGYFENGVVWNVPQKKRHYRFVNHGKLKEALDYSPDGRFLAAALMNGKIAILRAEDGKTILEAEAHKGPVQSFAWSPDGRRFATSSDDGFVAIWDSATATKLLTFSSGSAVHHVAWSPDSTQLACVCGDGTLRVWGSPALEQLPGTAAPLKTGIIVSTQTATEDFRLEEDRLTSAIHAAPNKTALRKERGLFYRRHQRWEKAVADFEVIARRWHGEWTQLAFAQLLAMTNRTGQYAEYCRQVSRELAEGEDLPVNDARMYVLRPIPSFDYERLLAFAQEQAKKHPEDWRFAFLPGAILYRMERYAEAVEVLEASKDLATRSQQWRNIRLGITQNWLALAHHQLGHSKIAQDYHEHAKKTCNAWMPPATLPLENWEVGGFIESHLLLREAQKLIFPQ